MFVDENMELANTKIERRQRWDKPFAAEWSEEDFARTLALPVFANMDADKFPAQLSLNGIVRNDARLVRYDTGDIVARVDDYGSSAFIVVSGEVTIIHPPGLAPAILGREVAAEPEGWLGAIKRLFSRSKHNETRLYAQADWDITKDLSFKQGIARVKINNIEEALAGLPVTKLGAGELIGEVAALTRSPRTASMVVTESTELLEIRWQGFRDLRKYDEGFRRRIDDIYRERNRVSYLKSFPFFDELEGERIEFIAEQTLLESYGSLEWKASRKKGEQTRAPAEPAIVNQGDYVDGLLIVLNGGARIVGGRHAGNQTIGFLRGGDVFGMHEIVANRDSSNAAEFPVHQYGLTAIGHCDVLRIPTHLVENELLQNLSPEKLAELADYCAYPPPAIDPGFQEFVGEHQYTNGRSTMVIDTSRCVRCDECVTACARNHDNNPRFLRHGHQFSNLMITNACMHCVDPVCMVGCPTGAISRRVNGEVVINDETCIGCSTCANSCPYDNIRMVEISDKQGNLALDDQTHKPIVKATKCDLCADNLGGPACERACPHDALSRIDLTDTSSLNALLMRAASFE